MQLEAKTHYDKVDLYLLSAIGQNAAVLRQTLMDLEFREIRTGATIKEARKALESKTPNLLIADYELADGNICELIEDIRHHRLGSNPFVPIIVSTWQPSEALVHSVINSGADDLLVQPTSRSHLQSRINAITFNRKPFVVTATYIGPDRRSTPRPGTQVIQPIEVPNALRSVVLGNENPAAVQNEIAAATASANLYKLERNSIYIGFLVQKILAGCAKKKFDGELVGMLKSLTAFSEDINRRAVNTQFENVTKLSDAIIDVASRLERACDKPLIKDLKLLPELAMTIRLSLRNKDDGASAAEEISNVLSGPSKSAAATA